MAGLVPAIHVFVGHRGRKTWLPGTRPGMTAAKFTINLKTLQQAKLHA
jgi:hypothetical protein